MSQAYCGRGADDRVEPSEYCARSSTIVACSRLDVLADILRRVRLSGTLLFHYELSVPWSLALPRLPDAVFHYLRRGSATLAFESGKELRMGGGDFVLIAHGDPHILRSDRRTKP